MVVENWRSNLRHAVVGRFGPGLAVDVQFVSTGMLKRVSRAAPHYNEMEGAMFHRAARWEQPAEAGSGSA